MASAPEELTAYAALISTPDGQPVIGIVLCWCGDLDEGEKVLKPLRAFGPPLMDTVQPVPFPVMQRMLDDAFPDGTYNYWKSTFIRQLNDEAIGVIVDHANGVRSPLSGVVIEYYAGAASRVGVSDTAFAQRQAEYDIGFMAQWTDAAEANTHTTWARDMADAMKAYSSGGHLLNFQSEESADTIRAAFGANYPRLAEIKKKYDPTNFFSINQNIRSAG
jgi:Berberine and berberine like